MTRPLSIEERDGVQNLAVECEKPERLRALLAEYLRLRAFAAICRRHSGRMPRAVQIAMQQQLPTRNTAAEWAAGAAGNCIVDDPRLAGTTPRLI